MGLEGLYPSYDKNKARFEENARYLDEHKKEIELARKDQEIALKSAFKQHLIHLENLEKGEIFAADISRLISLANSKDSRLGTRAQVVLEECARKYPKHLVALASFFERMNGRVLKQRRME